MDWLGAIAGIEKFLLKWITVVFGGWLHYNAGIEIINVHYQKKDGDDGDDGLQIEDGVEDKAEQKVGDQKDSKQKSSMHYDHHHIHQLNLSTWERLKCYFSSKYAFIKLCCGSKKTLT
jgi:ABC-type Zn2+ transport system substrate-binding protein/surface adhesin